LDSRSIHVLKTLSLPDRFENLRQVVGDRVAELLVEPGEATLTAFRRAARSIGARGEGLFAPIVAASGTGKTTLASSLSGFLPDLYAPTVTYTGPLDYDSLNRVVEIAREKMPADDSRALPINVDHRESAPPSPPELAAIKRFLRAPSLGARVILVWPEVSSEIAAEVSHDYEKVAGESAVRLPIIIDGPPRAAWQDITSHTLQLVNGLVSIEDLGISPRDYDPEQFQTIGALMRRISNDFTALVDDMLAATLRPLSLAVVYASESYNAGVLSQLTSGTRYGLLDTQALISATPNSVIGRWWTSRRGLLTQTILKLNARAFCLPPATAVTVLRACGPAEVAADLEALGVTRQSASGVHQYIGRSDFGKYLAGSTSGAYEARGRPAANARAAIALLAGKGFTYGRDKSLNQAMLDGLKVFLEREQVEYADAGAETQLSFCPLIPDNFIDRGADILCVEYTWRAGDFLGSSHRSEAGQYALTKLKNYAVALGWAQD